MSKAIEAIEELIAISMENAAKLEHKLNKERDRIECLTLARDMIRDAETASLGAPQCEQDIEKLPIYHRDSIEATKQRISDYQSTAGYNADREKTK